ncbi:helix-turn-helix transcriptional regulator [Bifidobacterium saeculare]|uniref:helix-turn-helix domain-containing protein n=1 Tax=Bifidobacterium pullorum TaxID=78448 RepID=UPI0018757305|nr:helix-turn-helix transcriptional regulator [Bifidobacterium pullorum]MBE5065095.1 helix-turn-helix transcriptional regulator [Bifidobacterium pullorum subsp. saeculare]
MTRELLTEELLDRLISSPDIQSYLDQDSTSNQTLTVFLETLREANNMKRSVLARESGLNATVVYDIFAGKSRPGRDHAIMLSIGLNCDLRETQRLLRLAGVSELWCKQRRDAIIIWCIEHGFDLTATDNELQRLGEQPLLQSK